MTFLTLGKTQFNSPHGFCLGPEEEIVVADTNNHRIQVLYSTDTTLHALRHYYSFQVFEKNGTFRYQFGIPGKEEGQLWYPRKVGI